MSQVRKMPTLLHPEADRVFHNDSANRYFFEKTFRSKQLDPERSLLLAILQDAIERQDWEWISRPGYEPWGISFDYVCEHLGLDADYMRSGLNRVSLTPPVSHQAPDSSLARGS